MKRVLILCTGNSCRSIMAEGLINLYLKDKVIAYSAGSDPKGEVNKSAIEVLKEEGAWRDSYYSKSIEAIEEYAPFDLIISVCDRAKDRCVNYFKGKKHIHIPFIDPDGKGIEEFKRVKEEIKEILLKRVKEELAI